MKSIIITAIVTAFILSSCCKGAWEVVGIRVSYPNLTTTSQLKAEKSITMSDGTIAKDTIPLGELNTSNSFSTFFEIKDNSLTYLIFIEDTEYLDTISEVNYEREGCDEHIVNFNCKFNGELRTDNELSISN